MICLSEWFFFLKVNRLIMELLYVPTTYVTNIPHKLTWHDIAFHKNLEQCKLTFILVWLWGFTKDKWESMLIWYFFPSLITIGWQKEAFLHTISFEWQWSFLLQALPINLVFYFQPTVKQFTACNWIMEMGLQARPWDYPHLHGRLNLGTGGT